MEMDMDMMNQWLPDMKRVVEGIGTGLALAADAVCEKNLFNTPALVAMAATLSTQTADRQVKTLTLIPRMKLINVNDFHTPNFCGLFILTRIHKSNPLSF